MRDFHIGDRVTFFGRAYIVRGFSPMSVTRASMYLEDAQTGEQLEVAVDELTGKIARTGADDAGPKDTLEA